MNNYFDFKLGRRECLCEATRHSLIANCLSCGRIVCAQEGSGECFTCGQLVLTPQERQQLMADSKANQSRVKSVNESRVGKEGKGDKQGKGGLKGIAASFETEKGLEKAIEHKERLLEFDKNSSVRTKVIDDENDYFSLVSQNWVSNQTRKTITSEVEKLHENKLKTNKKILIDLNQRTATDYSEPVIKDFDQQVQNLINQSQLKTDYQMVDASNLIAEDNPKKLQNLEYISPKFKSNDRSVEDINVAKQLISSYSKLRIQDKQLMEMCDEGMCLSVGQPYASLLVSGIKRYEGRDWYSAFRGRLWIRSNTKPVKEECIKKVENLYRYAGFNNFPLIYPNSALLGCVTVTDCLPIEEYRLKYPDSEADDNYIFVCEDPKQMSNPLPIAEGGHRIYKLNETIHSAAKKLIKL